MQTKKILLALFSIIFLTLFINTFTIVYAADVLLTSYDYSNRSTWQALKNFHPSATTAYSAVMESFRTPDDGVSYLLKAVNFSLYRVGTPIGDAYAKLYAHSGTFGTSSVPTGSPLATSLPLNVTTLATAYVSGVDTTMNFTDGYTMAANTTYCLTFENPASGTIDNSNYVQAGVDATSPTYEGNYASYRSSAWTANSAADLAAFAVWGEAGQPQGQNLSFQLNETILIAASNSMGKALGFQQTDLLMPSGSASMNRATQFLNYGSINFYATIIQNKALGFTLTELLKIWDNCTSTFVIYGAKTYNFVLGALLNIASSSDIGKSLTFQLADLLRLFDSGSMGFAAKINLFTLIGTPIIDASLNMVHGATEVSIADLALGVGVLALVIALCGLSMVFLRRRGRG